MKTLFFVFMSFALFGQDRRQMVFDKYAPPYEVGRAILPGVLCFIGGALPDTKRGRIWQTGLFFTGGVSIGAWKNTTRKQKLIYGGCALAGMAAGFIVRNNTK